MSDFLDRGRAAPRGIVTRRSNLVRTRQPGVRPLPLELQVLPQRLKRTKIHTGCLACAPGIKTATHRLITNHTQAHFRSMEGLDVEPQRYRITLEGTKVRYTDSFAWGWAWVQAATLNGLWAEMEDCGE